MKKLIALLLALIMLVSLAACGGKGNDKETDKPEDSKSETKNEAPAKEPNLETPLWTLSYDEDEWNRLEDNMYTEEDYCSVNFQILDPEDPDYYLIDIVITASLEDAYDFRDDLVYYGFDQHEYKVNNAYDLTQIGGVDLLKYEGESWGEDEVRYFNRIEGAGATVSIDISAADASDSRISALLDGLTFVLEDVGNVDGPWEWEGEPFSTENHSVTAGSFTLDSKWIPFEEYVATFDTFTHDIAAVGNTVYILSEGVLKQYAYDGEGLSFEKDIELPEDDYEYLQATDDGSLWLCGSLNVVVNVKDGKVASSYEELDNVALHPSGTWGISYFVGSECQKVTFNADSHPTTPITFSEVDTISRVWVDENNSIYVSGYAADDSGHKVFIYDENGALQKTLCDAEGEGLGSITYFARTANGYIGFDGNMRSVLLWGSDGSFIAEPEDDELFGTYYPWFASSTILSDGSILTVMTEEREDRSATEVIVFNVKGF